MSKFVLRIVCTGASKGFGRSLVVQFAKRAALDGGSVLLAALGRDEAGLQETASQVKAACPAATVITHVLDMSDLDGIAARWSALADLLRVSSPAPGTPVFDVLLNNSGSLGAISPSAELSLAAIRSNIDSNVTATMWLTSLYLQYIRASRGGYSSMPGLPEALIVNVSSLCAIKGFPTQSLYCVNKAARDMFTAIIAQEEGPAVMSLNYAPGPLDTAMQAELRDCQTLQPDTRALFHRLKDEGTLLNPDTSAAKCVRLVLGDTSAAAADAKANGGCTFESGAHVDFYELPDITPL